jgi:DNA-binding transcriptional LysR family regulator
MNIASAKTFLTVVAQKSVSRAAEILYLTQSTVSFQIKMLEEEIGVTLLERKKGCRQVDITPKGQEFIPIAERFLRIWDEALALQNKNTAHLFISSVDSINTYALVPFYQQILQGEGGDPPFRMQIYTYNTPEIFERVENHLADIGFVLSQRRYNNVIMKPIFQEKLLYVELENKKNKQRDMTSIHPSNLDFRKHIFFNWSPEFLEWINIWCGPTAQPFLWVDTIQMVMSFLKNDYWAIFPHRVIETLLRKQYPLFYCPIEEGPPNRICYKLTHRFPRRSQQSSIELFERKLDEFIRSNFADDSL